MSARGLALGIVLVASGILGFILLDDEAPNVEENDVRVPYGNGDPDPVNSPFAVQELADSEISSSPSVAPETPANATSVPSPVARQVTSIGNDEPIDGIGWGAMSDDDQVRLSAELRDDREKLLLLIDSLRTEGNAERIRRLSIVLGEQGDPAVDALIEELAYSDDPALVVAGLDLMKRSGVDGGRARAIVSTLLANESAPEILRPALSAIARPGAATVEERQDMANQISLLTSHDSADVRSASVDLLSRWTSDGSDTATLLDALQDDNAAVRRTAAYALVSHEDSSETVVAALLRTAGDADEDVAVRKAAILAVQRSQGADVDQRKRAEEMLKLLNRRPSRKN